MTSSSGASRPPGFRGRFTTRLEARRSRSTAAGPFRLTPRAVAVPRDVSDVQRLVRWASERRIPLVPRGAATGMPGGNVGRGVAVDMSTGFGELGPVDADSRRIRVEAGAVAGEVDRVAGRHGLFLPPLPSSADRCTIGGMVANNAAGARTFEHGATRDWVESLEVVLADGRHLRLGSVPPFDELRDRLMPRWPELADGWPVVEKNASGYALDRFLPTGDAAQLLVGSEGTLGVVTAVTLRLAPTPPSRALALLSTASPQEMMDCIRAAREADASACEFFARSFLAMAGMERDPLVGEMARGAYALVMVELAGTEARVRTGVERMKEAVRNPEADIRTAFSPEDRSELWSLRHAASPVTARAAAAGRASLQFIEDSVVPVDRLPEYLEGLERILQEAGTEAMVFGHAGGGNVHVNPLVDIGDPDWHDRVAEMLERTVALVSRLGGTLTGEHGDGRVRAPYLHRIWSELAVRSFRDVKEALDPDGILNPGVIIPLDGQDPLDGLSPPDVRAPDVGTQGPRARSAGTSRGS